MKVSDVDWGNWEPEESSTIMFVVEGSRVLLIHKKRGLGAGKINGPGGKIEKGETPIQCAVRETNEELHINPLNIRAAGELFFQAEDMPKIHGFVFVASGFEGTPTETDEATPEWFEIDNLPFSRMWDDDRLWLGEILSGQSVKGWFTFEEEKLLDYCVEFSD